MRRSLLLIAAAALTLAATAFAGAFPDGPGGPEIAIVNDSTVVSDEQLERALPGLQRYIDQVCQAWHCAGLLVIRHPGEALEREWQIVLNDESEIPDAIGYHVTEGSRPTGYVSTRTAEDAVVSWTVVFTHELAEMLVDPEAAAAVQTSSPWVEPVFTAREICDPVQGHWYWLSGIRVADFVYRSWFTRGAKGPYDSMRALSAPLQLGRQSWKAIFRDGAWTTASTFTAAHAGWDAFGGRRQNR